MKSLWARPPASFDQLGSEVSEYVRQLHEAVFGSGVGGNGRLSADNLDIAYPSGTEASIIRANRKTGKLEANNSIPLADLQAEGDGLFISSKGSGAVGTPETASPFINHRLTADYDPKEHYAVDDTVLYDPALVDDAANDEKATLAESRTWSAKRIIDYVADPAAPATVTISGAVVGSGAGSVAVAFPSPANIDYAVVSTLLLHTPGFSAGLQFGDSVDGALSLQLLPLNEPTADKFLYLPDGGELTDFKTLATADQIVTDHGALTGLADDDHTQYVLVNGTRAMTGDLEIALASTTAASHGLYVDMEYRPSAGGSPGVAGRFQIDNGAGGPSSDYMVGVLGRATQTASAGVAAYTIGVSGDSILSSGTSVAVYGLKGQASVAAGTTVTDAAGCSLSAVVDPGATATNLYGALVSVTPAAGTTNAIGLKIGSVAGATNNWAIQAAGGQSYHVGNLRIGSAVAPTAALDVTGAVKISTTLTVAGLTSGRVPYATTAGLLTDSANWLYDGTNWSMLNGNVAISGGSKINLNGSATSASGWSIRQSVKGVSFRAEGFFDYCYINGNGVFANLCGMHMGSGYKLTFDDGAGAYYIGRVAANNNIRIARAEGTGFAGAVDISQGYMSPVSGTAMALGAWTLGWSGLYLDESGAGTQTTLIRARTLNADNIVEPPTIDAGLVGSVNVNTTAVSNGNVSTVVDLQTWSMPASTLATDGDWVRIRAHFSTAANADLKTVYVYFGSTVVYQSNSAAYTAAEIDVEVLVVRTGATTQISTSRASADTTLLTTASTYATPAETLSSAVTIKTAGSRDSGTGNNNITSRILVVEWGGKDA